MSDPAVAAVLDAARAGGLLAGHRPVIAMLSGGRDSVCLLDVLVTVRGAGEVQALHVNYGLRQEAGEEQQHCVALCERLGVRLELVSAEPDESSEPGESSKAGKRAGSGREADDDARGGRAQRGNVQAWARELRYAAAERLAEPLDGLVATGHTATDQVESILYRLAASPGRRALLGMVAADGRLIRPLLGITREQTAAYCRARELPWRDDSSNDTDKYARGRVRGGLVPALRAVHPAAEANVLRTARLLREETELLDQLVNAELGDQDSIALDHLAELPAALARLVVVRLAEDASGSFVPQAGERVAEILALGARGGRAELHVGGLVSAVVLGGRLSMVAIEAHYPRPDDQ
jgi:tRNA(Ile)-lysidine synthase